MGRLPAEIRSLTPADTILMIDAWNAAHDAEGGETAPSREQLDDLMRQFPDG